jgi:DNA-binding PadR family transcriptional regulator
MGRERRKDRDRSELECFVLGVVWQLGPCSAYELRVHMARSPSTQWSGSAGAIYPLVRRLEKQRLLASKKTWNGRRASRLYRITPAGRRVLRRWIGPPLSPAAVTVSYDPLRSRARFLSLASPADREAWIVAAGRALDQVEARVRAWEAEFAQGVEPFAVGLTQSGELDVAARRKWLAQLRKASARTGVRS